MSAVMTVVETEPDYPFAILWREFPQLDRATLVGRLSYSGDECWGVVRTFRMLNGGYLRIHSWGRKDGTADNDIDGIPADELTVYEGVWRTMLSRGRLYDSGDDPADELTGIRTASHEYMVAVDDELDGWDEEYLDEDEEEAMS